MREDLVNDFVNAALAETDAHLCDKDFEYDVFQVWGPIMDDMPCFGCIHCDLLCECAE